MEELSKFRKELDEIDHELMHLIGRRLTVCRQVAEYKSRMKIPMMQPARVAEVKRRAAARAKSMGLSEQFGHDLYGVIIGEACRIEDEIIEGHAKKPA